MKWLVPLLVAASLNAQTIDQAVQAAKATPPFDRALLLIEVEDDAGNTIYAQNAHTLMIPASVRKLFSTAAAQQCLGNDARLPTELWLDGDDVIIKGGGDPSFGSAAYETSFAPFVDALRRRGVRRVRDVVADVSLFDRVTIPYQWKVGNLPSPDAAPVDAIAYNENTIGDQAVADAGFAAALAFRDALILGDIPVDGAVRVQTDKRTWAEKIAEIDSPFFEELLATCLKVSQNLYAEMLYKRISADDKPASYDASRELEAQFLRSDVGIEPAEFRFVDGCGLAPDDLVTPAAVVQLLRWMNAPERRATWWAVLAKPGEQGGTLRRRLLPLADRMRGKTGTVAGVNSLAGIISGRNGGFRYFAIAWNHHTGSSSVATQLIDAIVTAISDF